MRILPWNRDISPLLPSIKGGFGVFSPPRRGHFFHLWERKNHRTYVGFFGIEAVLFGRDDPFKVKRILLIEDESLIRSSLARALSRDGFTIVEAKWCHEALEE